MHGIGAAMTALRLIGKPPKPARLSPSVLERVTHRKPRHPTDYSRNVQCRWDAMAEAYRAERLREAQALSALRNAEPHAGAGEAG